MSDDLRTERFQQLYEEAPCGLLSISPDGLVDVANRTAERWLGYESRDLVGRRLLDILSLGGRVYWETHARPLLRIQGSVEGMALDFLTRGGETVPAFGIAVEIRRADGRVSETRLSVFRAAVRRQFEQSLVTARKIEAEQRRIAAEVLRSEREVAILREQFIAVLGHDLRNPLAGMLAGIQLLSNEALSERARRILPLMAGSADRMSALIDQVMDFAQARLGGGLGLDRRPDAPIEAMLLQVVDELRSAHPERTIELSVNVDRPVDCDDNRIGQLVSNLVGNALSHGAPAIPVRVVAATPPGFLEIFVSNGGKAIPQDTMDKLFQPFFRGDTRSGSKGLGLGLHIASEIARAHGGALTAISSEEETRFSFRMPLSG